MDPIEAEGNININGKNDVELEHTERLSDVQKNEVPPLTKAQSRRLKAKVGRFPCPANAGHNLRDIHHGPNQHWKHQGSRNAARLEPRCRTAILNNPHAVLSRNSVDIQGVPGFGYAL
jgi:hypothetical protein